MINNKMTSKILVSLLAVNMVFLFNNVLINAREKPVKPNNYSGKRPAPPKRIPPNKVKPGGGLDFSRQTCTENNKSLVALILILSASQTFKSLR